jgi:glyoxylase-like metal-dependent hydrolase (beta-lactamase superfamily II)
MDVIELSDRLWRGEVDIAEHHPVGAVGDLAEVADGVSFVPSFANVSAFATEAGLLLVDTGSAPLARQVHSSIRQWSRARLDTAVYSHGHIDHVFGVPVFEEEASEQGWAPPRVVAHQSLPARFDRYKLTAGYNSVINRRQFQLPGLQWPTEYRYPDDTYAETLTIEVGELRAELHHAKGETDDHTWTFVPAKKVICCGDLFIWASPNAGNPQKVQRYPLEWARALRSMAGLGAEVLLPGHGFPVIGRDRVATALAETAELLESLVDQALALMNEGARLDDLIHSVKPPEHLIARPYLRPVYDEPEFVVRNIWRLYGGWWDGNPANLHPAPERALAAEIASLANGARSLARRAEELCGDAGEPAASGSEDLRLRLAGHLAELAFLVAPEDPEVARVKETVFSVRATKSTSTMARGIYAWASRSATQQSDGSS